MKCKIEDFNNGNYHVLISGGKFNIFIQIYDYLLDISYFSNKRRHRLEGASIIQFNNSENPLYEEFHIEGIAYGKEDFYKKIKNEF